MKDPFLNLDRESIKKNSGNRFFELGSILNKHDPVGLIAIGCPEDEYDPEVATILVQLDKKMSEKEVEKLIHGEFNRWFNDESISGPIDAYTELAKDVNNWNQM